MSSTPYVTVGLCVRSLKSNHRHPPPPRIGNFNASETTLTGSPGNACEGGWKTMGFLVDSSVKPVSSLQPIVFLSKRSATATVVYTLWGCLSVPAAKPQAPGSRPGKEKEMGTDRPGVAVGRPC